MHRLAPIILFVSALPAVALGQRVSGVVTSGRLPVAGAVVALLDSSGRDVARALTDEFGHYRIEWKVGVGRLRVVRLGFRPLDNVRLAERRDTTIDLALERVPAMLDAVHVAADAVCPDSPDRRQALATWEQARAGLLSAIVAREAAPGKVTNLTFERGSDPRTKRIRWIHARTRSGVSSRPFVAGRTGAELARLGYRARLGSENVYFAPDADVLLDDDFAAAHCFGVERAVDNARRGQLGLSFVPRARSERSVVDVRGVLWIDPGVLALRDLEFHYTGLDQATADAGAGGSMQFATLANGVSFISEWTMVFPLFAAREAESGAPGAERGQRRATEMAESGGLVVRAEWSGDVVWKNPLPLIRGRVLDRETHAPIRGAVVTIEGLEDTAVTNSDGVYDLPVIPEGHYVVQAADTALQMFIKSRRATAESVVARDAAPSTDFALASASAAVARLCTGGTRPTSVTLLGHLSAGVETLSTGLYVSTYWYADVRAGASGQVASRVNEQSDVGDDGAFVLCGAAGGRTARLSLRAGRVPVADTTVEVGTGSFAHMVEWPVRRAVIEAAMQGGGAGVSGTVVDSASHSPIVDADVWLFLDGARTTTDSAGRFQVEGLSPGRHLVQLRKLGYTVRRDSVTLAAGADLARVFVMASQAATLDTVRVVARGTSYISAALRGFEERRATGMGQYIGEDVLRKEEHRDLADVLRRLPSLRIRIAKGSPAKYVEGGRSSGSSQVAAADPEDPKSPLGCWASVYLDGVAIYTGPPAVAPDVSRMQVSEFAGVEFYGGVGSAPPQYVVGRRAECGLLLLWTRER